MKYIKELIIAALIVLAGFQYFGGESRLEDQERRHQEYMRRKDQALDSLRALQQQAELEALAAMTARELANQRLNRQEEITQTLRRENLQLRNRRPAHLSDSAILREWTGLLTDR